MNDNSNNEDYDSTGFAICTALIIVMVMLFIGAIITGLMVVSD